jgi:hypothetical protein
MHSLSTGKPLETVRQDLMIEGTLRKAGIRSDCFGASGRLGEFFSARVLRKRCSSSYNAVSFPSMLKIMNRPKTMAPMGRNNPHSTPVVLIKNEISEIPRSTFAFVFMAEV